MKKLFRTWINNLNRPSPDTLNHGPDVPKNYNYPTIIPGEVIQKFTDLHLAIANETDQYVNNPENWWDHEEIQWQAGYRDALMTAVETLRQLIDTTTPPLDMSLVKELFPKAAS